MDQPKIERMLRLMRLMSGSVLFTIDELAEKMDTSYRTIYRYIGTFKDAGFVVEKVHGNIYRLMKMPKASKDLEKLVYFSEEEAKVLTNLIQGLDQSNGMKANLYKKLSAVYDVTAIERYTDNKKVAYAIQTLEEAISEGKRVVLKDYQSSNSGVHDVLVEPYEFTAEYVCVWAYDVVSRSNKMYKISRIGSVEILPDGWEFEPEHRKPEMDIFRMSGPTKTHVRIELNRRARNLLVEEFPLAEYELMQLAPDRWLLETDVTQMEGVGRFVIGLAADVRIVDSPALTDYVRSYTRFIESL